MGKRIITREVSPAVAGAKTTIFPGCFELVALSADFGASSSGTVITIKEKDADGLTKYVITTDTDFGTTVPVRIFHDARIIAGTATAGVGLNPVFFEGLNVAVTGDSSSTTRTSVKLWLRPLIYKKIQLEGVTQAKVVFNGPGLLKGARANYSAGTASTADIQISDTITIASDAPSGGALTVITSTTTDWAAVNQQLATTTGHDEAGSAVTTAATGAYANDGIAFGTGLTVGVAQGTANEGVIMDFAIEA